MKFGDRIKRRTMRVALDKAIDKLPESERDAYKALTEDERYLTWYVQVDQMVRADTDAGRKQRKFLLDMTGLDDEYLKTLLEPVHRANIVKGMYERGLIPFKDDKTGEYTVAKLVGINTTGIDETIIKERLSERGIEIKDVQTKDETQTPVTTGVVGGL